MLVENLILIITHSNKIIGDAEYRFAVEFQAQDMYGRKVLADKKTSEVCELIVHVDISRCIVCTWIEAETFKWLGNLP